MENQEPRSHSRLAASIILVLIIGASLIGAYLQTNSASTSTSSLTTTGPSGLLLISKT